MWCHLLFASSWLGCGLISPVTDDVHFDHLTEVVSPGFSTIKLLVFLLFTSLPTCLLMASCFCPVGYDPLWPVGAPWSLLLHFLSCPPYSLSVSLLSGKRYSRLILYFPCPCLGNQPLLQRVPIPFSGEWYLATIAGCPHGYCDIYHCSQALSVDRVGNVWVHLCTPHLHLSIPLSPSPLCVCICIVNM